MWNADGYFNIIINKSYSHFTKYRVQIKTCIVLYCIVLYCIVLYCITYYLSL